MKYLLNVSQAEDSGAESLLCRSQERGLVLSCISGVWRPMGLASSVMVSHFGLQVWILGSQTQGTKSGRVGSSGRFPLRWLCYPGPSAGLLASALRSEMISTTGHLFFTFLLLFTSALVSSFF